MIPPQALLKDLVRQALPFWLKLRLRQVGSLPGELYDRLRGQSRSLRPPRWLRDTVGDGDFDTVGQRFLVHCRELAGLEPDEAVLDVGCGVGRLALRLTGYLGSQGSYRGFDLVRPAIRWCQRHITPAFPHFCFEQADIHHPLYNPAGRQPAREHAFPFPAGTFDLVIVASVFTHLLAEEVKHYLAEIQRVLKPGGRCLATFFLLNDDSLTRMAVPGCRFHFCHELAGCWTTTPHAPEAAVAYREDDVRQWIADSGLQLREPIQFGSWCGRDRARDGQDLVLLAKVDHSRVGSH